MKAKARKRRGKSAAQMIADAKKDLAKQQAKSLKKPPQRIEKVSAQEAKSRTDHIKEVFQTMGKMWWELGLEVKKAIDDRVPQALGKSAHEWMEECFGESWLKIYRANRAIRALSGVEMSKLEKISEGNAYALARLPEKVRKSPLWIRKASTLTNEKFREAADRWISKKTGIKDPLVKLTDALGFVKVPKSFADLAKQVVELAGRVNNLDLDDAGDRIKAVEAIFGDYVASYGGEPFSEAKPAA